MGNELSALDNRSMFDESITPRTLSRRTVSAVADYLRSGHVKNVVFMVGAGISTSAGVPDFRSPDTGLYANLAKLNLPHPEAVFDIGFFQENPLPFFTLAKELYPGDIRPTIAHSFMKLMCDKGLVSQIFTQNIDCLERVAGIPPHLITEAHGSFATHSCTKCQSDYPDDLMRESVKKLEIPYCLAPQCNGVVKPDIVFFGEALPSRFFQQMPKVTEADLVIVMGTSLKVMPFATLPQRAKIETPRVLINRELVGGIGGRKDDVLVLESCDSGVRKLARYLGWIEELDALWAQTDPNRKLDKGKSKRDVYDGPMDMDEILRAQVESLTRDVEKGLKLADIHRHSVSHQLKMDEERRNTVPCISSQLDQRESTPPVTEAGTQLGSQSVLATISTGEARSTDISSVEASKVDDKISTGEEKAVAEATKDNMGTSPTPDNTTTPSSNL